MANIIKLCAPNLEDFICSFYLTQDYSLEIYSPPSAISFRMIFSKKEEDENAKTYSKLPSKDMDVYAKRLVKYLGAVYPVKHLRSSPGFLEVLSRAPDLLDFLPPRFCNLQSLVLETWPTGGCLRAIRYLLSISPNITRLFLEMKESNLSDVGDYSEAGLSFPEMLSHLEYFEFIDAEGSDAEFRILNFLLRNEKVLKKIGVTFRSSVAQRDRKRHVARFSDKIRAGRKASSSFQFAYNLKFTW
ncbi:hypothetical protein C5167_029080 [Papaver somniferum]|uniref:uncharacterized protein LOC113337002 n=1 Tax=Papaver somniferum TaxID=3469 RepID=UPI000E6F7408|nr:uncharacterized protein LOC113337002 [Papaver somniferum]RZC90013.1 hypothetical protein C5167_029080 [Papaver somniferum]